MNETTDATAIFAPIWRRKWLILIVGILVAVGSYLYYRREPGLYSATTQVYLGNGAEEQNQISASGSNGIKKASAPNPATQAVLINSSIIKGEVRDRLRKQRKTAAARAALKGKAKAKSSEKSEFITISAEAHNARGVALLANTTAQAYVQRQNAHYRREVEAAITLTRRQVRRIEAGQTPRSTSKGKSSSKGTASTTATLQAATLNSKINQLEANLPVKQVTQVDPATRRQAQLVSPHPKSNAIFGFVIGLLLASIVAYAASRFDRRLRSLTAIEEIYQTPILSALQAVRRPIVRRDGQPAPAPPLREGLWRLQTTLQVGNVANSNGNGTAERGPRVILCVSADPGDGKSTVASTLALAQAEAGERVAVVEADFRRPVQGRLLGVDGPQGLADVLTGRLTVEEAMQEVSLVRSGAGVGTSQTTVAGTATVVDSTGSVSVLVGATMVANPPALLARPAMNELSRTLADSFDYVLIDAPPPLQVSDVMPLMATVDGIVIVARLGHTRETSAQRLVQLLQRTPSAPVLGVVANAVSPSDIEKYGLSGRYKPGWRQKLSGR
ncbi:MAG: P-loop NTPase [Solirubrobacteraceae bacterium]|jgi:Mrp family chromosome partitioning ATPase